jgi:anhydro-N-acetylmuramic acid kinase
VVSRKLRETENETERGSAVSSELFVGLMSGTSVDGVDAVLADFSVEPCRALARTHVAFAPELRAELNALQRSGADEIHRGSLAANALMDCCATAVAAVLSVARRAAGDIAAIGLHGQTIRHRPELGYTTQLANPARLAEATGITVVADFRSRDVAAAGQGAPLVPAFHAAAFAAPDRHRVVVNIGGIANITDLPPGGPVRGFDTGPGNTLMDAWCERHTGQPYDRNGAWGGSGRTISELLRALRAEPYFALPPPKSTGRDRFHMRWLAKYLNASYSAQDVQRTLIALTAQTIAAAIGVHCAGASEVLVCGGGAQNSVLMSELEAALKPRRVTTTAAQGVAINEVEALAFAWLAREAIAGRPGNVPTVTGARGPRVLGAIYRA